VVSEPALPALPVVETVEGLVVDEGAPVEVLPPLDMLPPKPEALAALQLPATQASPVAHGEAHAPQWVALLLKSAQS
jgi:hypothetical protein